MRWLIAFVLWGWIIALSAEPTVCVLYPAVEAPYYDIFLSLLSGVRANLNTHRCEYARKASEPAEYLTTFLEDHRPGAVLTLGREVTLAFEAQSKRPPYIIGALDITPNTRPQAIGISLAPAPELVFDRLKRLVPRVTRVLTVYDAERDAWTVPRMQQAATERGLQLIAQPARTLVDAGRAYGNLVRTANPGADALWFRGSGSVTDEPHVLEYLIDRSWDRHIVLFSSALQAAKAGALFASYPDLPALGRRLADWSKDLRNNPNRSPKIELLSDLKFAVNIRILRHLSIQEDREILNLFEQHLDPKGIIE